MYREQVPLTNYSKDKYIAPEISKFTMATIRDMSKVDSEHDQWQAHFILSVMFGSPLPTPQRQQLINFLRRSHSALTEYSLARTATLGFLNDTERSLQYLDAIGHWEAFLGYAWQAYCFLAGGHVRLFKKGDGSVLQRLNSLHNRAKHADEAIERGHFIGDSPLCVWLTNEGLRSTETSLTFDEIAEIVEELARWASAVKHPATAREQLERDKTASRSSP
jgi:hypothetical protein